MAFCSTPSFPNIFSWSFRSLRRKVWEIKTLTVSSKSHTQNISILTEGNTRAPQSSGEHNASILKQFFLTVAKPVVLKHRCAPESPGGPVRLPGPTLSVWFSRSGGARICCCWPRDPDVSTPPPRPLASSQLDLAKSASLVASASTLSDTVLVHFFIPQIWQFYQVLMSICSGRKISSFGCKVVLLGLLKTLKSTLFSNITHLPCFFSMVPFPGIWHSSVLWS